MGPRFEHVDFGNLNAYPIAWIELVHGIFWIEAGSAAVPSLFAACSSN